jgi:hypothetical protein
MLKPKSPEPGVWKDNMIRKSRAKWRPTSIFLIEKYIKRQHGSVFDRLGGYKRERTPGMDRVQHDYNQGNVHKFDGWRHQPRGSMGRYQEIPR